MKGPLIVGVDFDGTCVEHHYPNIGPEVANAGHWLRLLASRGCLFVLWTVRSGPELQAAVDWFAERELPLWGINENPQQKEWSGSPKAFCHVYVDDAALGCPLVPSWTTYRPMVDWSRVGPALVALAEQPAQRRINPPTVAPPAVIDTDDDVALRPGEEARL